VRTPPSFVARPLLLATSLLVAPALAGCGSDAQGATTTGTSAASGGEGGASSSSAQGGGGSAQGGGGEGGVGQGGAAQGGGGAGGAAGSGGSGGSQALPEGPPCDVDGVPGTCVDVAECTGDFAPTPGFCPGPANIQCCTKIMAGACDPSAMPLPNEGLVEDAGIGGCPPGMLPITDFCIDRYEASLVHVDGGASFSPYFNPGIADLRAVSIQGAVPQGFIDQVQAASACVASGKRLCTDVEWLRACRGPDEFVLSVWRDARSSACATITAACTPRSSISAPPTSGSTRTSTTPA
jgi:hypothetical protein